MSSLPTPSLEDSHKSSHMRRSSKSLKSVGRTSKRASLSYENSAAVIDGRHKRVWKACERCRMKKTKCDGESPCKRCKDDGLVCTAGSRKKTEFKQLPRGYAEVLENTQYALIATVQKLYMMVRNNEEWELGEPELNDRGQPVIHDIASKLGCIRPSPDLPFAFPEGAEGFARLQADLQAARAEMALDDTGSRKPSSESSRSSYSPGPRRTERASSSDSDHSELSSEYNRMLSSPRSPTSTKQLAPNITTKPLPSKFAAQHLPFDDNPYQARTAFNSMPSPIYADFQAQSPMFRAASPFSPWSGGDDYLGQAHALDLTAQFMQQQQYPPNLSRNSMGQVEMLKAMQLADRLDFAAGTVRPGMLDCNNVAYEMGDGQIDNIMFGTEYDNQMGVA